ncbi:hypothetical protein ACFX15_007391 [Malus domestica]
MSSGDGDSTEAEYIWRHHRHEPRKNQGTSTLVRHIKTHVHLELHTRSTIDRSGFFFVLAFVLSAAAMPHVSDFQIHINGQQALCPRGDFINVFGKVEEYHQARNKRNLESMTFPEGPDQAQTSRHCWNSRRRLSRNRNSHSRFPVHMQSEE